MAIEGVAVPIDRGSMTVGKRRTLAWTAWGLPEGAVVFELPHFGASGARRTTADDQRIRAAGARLISMARPGLGGSTRHPGRTVVHDAEDLAALVDAFGVDRARVLGACAGAGIALAFAARFPTRVRAVSLVSAFSLGIPGGRQIAPTRTWKIANAMKLPVLGPRVARKMVEAIIRDPDAAIEAGIAGMAPPERLIASEQGHRAMERQSLLEFAASAEVLRDEYLASAAPWPFGLAEVRHQVTVWHGALDRTAPVGIVRVLERWLPRPVIRVAPDAGHNLGADREAEILGALVAV